MQIFCIHGWGGSAKSLQPLGNALVEKLKTSGINTNLQILELPGFGQTPLTREFSFIDYVDYVRSIISSKSVPGEELLILGHSFGGKIIMQLGIDKAFLQAKFVLINASGIFPNNSLKKTMFKVITLVLSPLKLALKFVGLEKFFRKAFYKYVVGARDYEKIKDPKLKDTFKQVIEAHIDEKLLSEIDNKTLVIWGGSDKDTPLWMGEKIAAAIPQSELAVFPEATHGLPLREPEAVAAKVQEWLMVGRKAKPC